MGGEGLGTGWEYGGWEVEGFGVGRFGMRRRRSGSWGISGEGWSEFGGREAGFCGSGGGVRQENLIWEIWERCDLNAGDI